MATAVEEFVTERLGFDLSLGIATAMEEEWYLTEANLDYVDLRNLDRRHIQRKIDERWLPNGAWSSMERSGGEDDYVVESNKDSSGEDTTRI